MSKISSPESISSRSLQNRTIILVALISLVVFIPLLFLAHAIDFDRWTAQWQVWWGLRQAEETAVAQATIISFYQENEDNFILYRYSAPNGLQYEKTEQVKNSIYRQAETGEPIMVDFAIDDPSIAGITGNIDPFSGPTAILIVAGLIMLRSAGKRRRYILTPSLLEKVSKSDSANETQPIISQRRASRFWPGIDVVLIALLLLIIQFILIYIFLAQ